MLQAFSLSGSKPSKVIWSAYLKVRSTAGWSRIVQVMSRHFQPFLYEADVERVNQRFGDEHAAKLAEMASFVRQVIHVDHSFRGARRAFWSAAPRNHPASAARTARTNAAIRA